MTPDREASRRGCLVVSARRRVQPDQRPNTYPKTRTTTSNTKHAELTSAGSRRHACFVVRERKQTDTLVEKEKERAESW
jgi:hypothetical protein